VADEKKVHHLNIFLIKPAYSTSAQVLNTESCRPPVDVPIAGHGSGQLFVRKTEARPPKWAFLFEAHIEPGLLAVPGISAALFIETQGRCFVVAFGQGGRFLVKPDVFEERFGLLCALNSVDPKTFRCVDVQSMDAIQSHTRIQSGQETTPDQFGLDIEQDLLKAIVGSPVNPALGNRMTGSDSLSVSVRMDLSDLPFLLNEYRRKFESELSAEDHQWVNNVSMTKSAEIIATLEAALNTKLEAGDFQGVWLAIPEIVEWSTVKGFMYTYGRKELHPDINWDGFRKTIKDGEPVTLDLLREREVHCADADHNRVFKSWSVFKCLYAEVDLGTNKFILNDGKWFNVAKDFVARTDTDFAAIPYSKLSFPEYQGGGEGAYNESVVQAESGRYALLDKKPISHGCGHGQIEVCDLFSINRDLVHVKIYGKSSVFSHLFSQGFVSGQLIQIDSDFRNKVRGHLVAPFVDLVEVDAKPGQDQFTIVYAIISDAVGDELHLPFFSRVNLNNTRKILRGYGYKVELLKIAVNNAYARTSKIPASRKARGSRA